MPAMKSSVKGYFQSLVAADVKRLKFSWRMNPPHVGYYNLKKEVAKQLER
jgi:hypothetical protein